MEKAAREVVGRVLSNPDVQNVGESIRAGAMKVSFLFLSRGWEGERAAGGCE